MKVTRGSRRVSASSETDEISSWEDLDLYEQIEVMKKFVRNYTGTKVFEDFAHNMGVDVEDIIDTFCDAEAHGDIKIPWKKQKDSEYANNDIYGATHDYGGAYDLENEGFFTKDDLVEFDNLVIEILQERYTDTFRIDDSYIEDNTIYLSVQSSEGNWAEGSVKVDMRKIRKPSDILMYSSMMAHKLEEELDTVHVESATSVEGSMLPGPGDYDPPKYDEPVELDEATDCINVQLDADIVIDADGSWEYVDDTYSWACPDEKTDDWYSDESGVYLDDCVGVVEKVDDLMADLLPRELGTYHVSGDVNLYYSTIGLEEYRDYYSDEDGHLGYDSIPANDNADVHYVEEESSLDDFQCVPN